MFTRQLEYNSKEVNSKKASNKAIFFNLILKKCRIIIALNYSLTTLFSLFKVLPGLLPIKLIDN